MKGNTISHFRAKHTERYQEKGRVSEFSLQILKIIKDLCMKVSTLHANDIFLGDISENNILIDERNSSVNFVDVEQVQLNVSSTNVKNYFRTPGFFDERTEFLTPKQQDIQQLGYAIMALFCKANKFLIIDKSGLTTIKFFKEFAKRYNIPKKFVSIVLNLIEYPFQKTLDNVRHASLHFSKYNFQNIKHQSNDLVLNLKKTLYASYIDGWNRMDLKSYEIKRNINFSDSRELEYSLIKIIIDKQIRNPKEELIHSLNSKLNKIIKNQESVKEVNEFGLEYILFILDCYLLCKFKFSFEEMNGIEIIINHVLNNYMINNKDGILGFKNKLTSNKVTPYLNNGTAGVLITLLIFKKKSNIDSYDEIINKLALSLKMAILPQNASLSKGLAGVIFALLKYKQIMCNNSMNTVIEIMIQELQLYTFTVDGNLYIISPNFDKVSIDLLNGNLGVLKVLDHYQEMINREE